MEEFTMQELTLKDFEGIKLDPNCFQIDYLAAIAKRAMDILDHEEHRKKKDKVKQKLSDSEQIDEQRRKEKDKGKRKLCDCDHPNEQPRKKKNVEEERNRETLESRFSKGVRIKEFSERVISRDREYRQIRLSKGVCIKERSETVIRRSEKHKRNEDSLLSREEISRREKLLERPVVGDKTASDHEYQELKKIKESKKIIKKQAIDQGPNPPPELPRNFMETLHKLAEGKSIKELQLVIQKGLFGTDISKCHNRLSMPSRHLLHKFLTDDEIAELKLHNGKNVNSIEADIIEPSLEKGRVSLRRWEMKKDSGKSSISYVFTGTWHNIVSRNLLRIGHVVQVWSVRVDGELWFLLVKVPNGGERNPISTARFSRASGNENEAMPSTSPSDPSEPGPSSSSKDPDQDP